MENEDDSVFDAAAIPGKRSLYKLVKKGDDFDLLYDERSNEFWIVNISIPYWRSHGANWGAVTRKWNSLESGSFDITEQWLMGQIQDIDNLNTMPPWVRPTLSSLEIGASLVVSYTSFEDPNMMHLGEDFPALSDMDIGDALEISYKPRLKPMKKMKGPKLQKFRKQYRKTKMKRKQAKKKWVKKNKSQLKRRAKLRHFKKRR